MDDEADAADVRRVLSGDIDAFEGIVRRWQAPLVNLAFRFCRDRDLAEDLAQTAFVRVYRKLRQWRADAAFSSWMFAVAYSVYRSEMRRTRPKTIPLESAGHEAISTDDSHQAIDRAELVRSAVASLPPRYRDVMILFYFYEMDVAKTSATLGVPQGTVKARLHRARAMLREGFADG